MGKKRVRKKSGWRNFIFAAVLVTAIVFLYLGNKYLVAPCANSISCITDLSGNYEPTDRAVFMGKNITIPSYIGMAKLFDDRYILGQTQAEKHIYVDLTHQQLFAYEGDQLIYTFPVSTGKWYHTPTGDFKIWVKLRYTRMKGGSVALGTYYNLPNVPFTMFYYNDQIPKTRGFALHGAYWHNNFGHPMSHGCVNISVENAEKLYYWADPPIAGNTTYATAENPGTTVTIYGVTPKE